ncbi:hypothetical protein ACFL35_09545 [Candidatus Riflebacteria bacterium]
MSSSELKALGILIASLFVIWSCGYVGYSFLFSRAARDKTSIGPRFYQNEIAFVDMEEENNKRQKRKGRRRRKRKAIKSSASRGYYRVLQNLKSQIPDSKGNSELAKITREETTALFEKMGIPVHSKFVEVMEKGATFIPELEKADRYLRNRRYRRALDYYKRAIQTLDDGDWIHLLQALDGLLICFEKLNQKQNYIDTKKQQILVQDQMVALKAEAFPDFATEVTRQKPVDLNKSRLSYKLFLRKNTRSTAEYEKKLQKFNMDFEAYTNIAEKR